MPDERNPKVFLSHASEDKERFVLPFAEKLRSRGLDMWVDRWEMLPGDSLVHKIFIEGLESASAVVVVISRNSLAKPWVAEELDAAVVKRIEEGSKLIPVVLDGLTPRELPAPIRHLLFEPVPDPTQLDEVVDRVARAIQARPDRPPLGEPPTYASRTIVAIHGLDRIDNLILKAAGEEAIRDCGTVFDTAEFVESVCTDLDISEAQAIESLEVLDNDMLIEIQRTLAAGLPGMRRFVLTSHGLESYLRSYERSYPEIEETVVARLAGWPSDQGYEHEFSATIDAPRLIVQHILEDFSSQGLIKISKSQDGTWHFHSISPKLRRLAT